MVAVPLLVIVIAVICIVTAVSHGKDKKHATQPFLCEEPLYPQTLKAEGGEYTRKLSTNWWVRDVKNGKVIIEDVNRLQKGKKQADDLGVVDLQGRIIIVCDNREVHFTDKGYIAAWHSNGSKSVFNYYNMGGNCLASIEKQTPESRENYGEAVKGSDSDHAKITDKVDGKVHYFGKYAVVSEYDDFDRDKKMNTCVYEFIPAQ